MRAALAHFDGGPRLSGYVYFEQQSAHKPVIIWASVSNGLVPHKEHAFHIHEYGDARDGCASMGGHYNPYSKAHGSWVHHGTERHVGDLLNNLPAANDRGGTRVRFSDPLVTLFGTDSVYGCSVVIHEGTDDLGMGGTEESLTTGSAGKRIACAPIVRCAVDPSLRFD